MTGITFLTATGDDRPDGAVLRAGGTDLQERLRSNDHAPHIADLTAIPGFAGIETTADSTRIGAGTTIATTARELADRHPSLALTAGGLATPQVRAVGTIGGNLLQRTRCWYYRHPAITCFKSGGDSCPARDGRHLYGVVFDRSACVHPHPSSIAMALLAAEATIELSSGAELTVAELLGDGTDPTADHLLPDGEILTAIAVPAPWPDERGAYFRSISRFEAEWPLVEATVRVRLGQGGAVDAVALAVGGVATVPLRMPAAEAILLDGGLEEASIAEAAASCAEGAEPLPETGYKIELIEATVREVLERARG